MRFLSIDIETTGLNPETCQVLEIGAVVGNFSTTPVENLPTFQTLIRHNPIKGDPFALVMNVDLLRSLNDAPWPRDAMNEFMDFCVKHFPGEKITAAGKNFGSFDLQFLQRMPGWKPLFHSRVLDPGPMYFWPDDACVPNLAVCLERAGLPSVVTHRAVDDARQMVELIRRAKC